MNAPIHIISTHFGSEGGRDQKDLALSRLSRLVADDGGHLAAIGRLCNRPAITAALQKLDALLEQEPDRDTDLIGQAIGLLEGLRDTLVEIPTDCEIDAVILDGDQCLVENLDGALRFAGARVEDNIRALRQLMD